MARRRRSNSDSMRSSRMPSTSSLRAAAAAVLAFALTILILINLQPSPDDSICDTPAADQNPELCGTTTRICTDSSETQGPRPLMVIAAGESRAASTWLYNALRILLRIRDPNTVHGWHADLQNLYDAYGLANSHVSNATLRKELASRADAYRSLGTVLVKLHIVQDWHEFNGGGDADTNIAPYVDAVFTTHRDVREIVRSTRDMGWAVKVQPARLAHPDFCRKRKVKEVPTYLRSEQFKKESTWVNLARAHLKCRQAMFESSGDKLKMDLRAEEIRKLSFEGVIRKLGEIGQHLDYAYSPEELQLAARELTRLRPPVCNSGFPYEMDLNPVTHLHKGHVRFVKSQAAVAVDKRGMKAISADPECAAWLRKHNYI